MIYFLDSVIVAELFGQVVGQNVCFTNKLLNHALVDIAFNLLIRQKGGLYAVLVCSVNQSES